MTEISKEHCDNCNNEVCCCIIKTQETLEEASKRYSYGGREGGHITPFLEGVKWQQEKSYSEEEVHHIIQMYSIENYDIGYNITYDEWFEQFKKK